VADTVIEAQIRAMMASGRANAKGQAYQFWGQWLESNFFCYASYV